MMNDMNPHLWHFLWGVGFVCVGALLLMLDRAAGILTIAVGVAMVLIAGGLQWFDSSQHERT